MSRIRSLVGLLVSLTAAVLGPLAAAPPTVQAEEAASKHSLRVMTYNVRMPSENDGPDYWELRKEIAAAVVRDKNPDIFGTQELFHHQGEYLVSALPEYRWFGVSRQGNKEDEHMGVFYKPERLELFEHGNFWLSETPEVPASMSWDVSLPRMVTWGLFQVKASGKRFYFLNTHFPHRRQDSEARAKCAAVIAKYIESLPKEVPVVLVGDFNDPAGEKAHTVLTANLKDAWTATGKRSGPEGTFHGFKGTPRESRIDWVLYRGPWSVSEAETVTYNENNRYPSDHFPVLVEFMTP